MFSGDDRYMAYVMADDGDDLIEVDIRTLSGDRLATLRVEAVTAHDWRLVTAIDSLTLGKLM